MPEEVMQYEGEKFGSIISKNEMNESQMMSYHAYRQIDK